jgi:hypothetical protein
MGIIATQCRRKRSKSFRDYSRRNEERRVKRRFWEKTDESMEKE